MNLGAAVILESKGVLPFGIETFSRAVCKASLIFSVPAYIVSSFVVHPTLHHLCRSGLSYCFFFRCTSTGYLGLCPQFLKPDWSTWYRLPGRTSVGLITSGLAPGNSKRWKGKLLEFLHWIRIVTKSWSPGDGGQTTSWYLLHLQLFESKREEENHVNWSRFF